MGRRAARWTGAVLAALLGAAAAQALAEEPEAIEWIFIPFPIYSPETGWALTLNAIGSARLGAGPVSSGLATLAYSEKGQKSLFIDPTLYLGEQWQLQGRVGIEEWPEDYYGLGRETREADAEQFESRNAILDARVQRRLGSRMWLGSRVVRRDYRMQETVPGGLLEQQSPAGVQGATVAGLGVLATLDSREDVLAPTRGLYLSGAFTAYGPALGGDHAYREAELDARQFMPLAPGWTLALHQYVRMTRGDVPFQELSLIGNSAFPARMRGYVTGRFRDNDTAILQSELRFPLYRRLSGVGFAAVGDVAPRLTDIRPDRLHWTAGGGLRLRASSTERVNLRLDAAFGEGTSGIYFRVFEAF